ncbi:MAG: hypothetical protein FD161_329 [Limisphaerales bacterium]|nr:MAG: hypothetical protein FD161_329 [Limisphaerales bacterium]KAG0510775.1 MAG: hypothetical protein E1N63_329 [Limisphaerales bacterium]TXT52671.1 MAG: hypothetical protein FD140_591 [Limisphaerales bacterium]
MSATLPLASMTTEEKLQVMEQLWEDLCRDEQQVASPGWHGEVLAAREARIARGEARFSDVEEVKARLRQKLA